MEKMMTLKRESFVKPFRFFILLSVFIFTFTVVHIKTIHKAVAKRSTSYRSANMNVNKKSENSSGKNGKHKENKSKESAKKKYEECKEKLKKIKDDKNLTQKERKEEEIALKKQIKHWKSKMDEVGETHSKINKKSK
jgi:hypothetical protein